MVVYSFFQKENIETFFWNTHRCDNPVKWKDNVKFALAKVSRYPESIILFSGKDQ